MLTFRVTAKLVSAKTKEYFSLRRNNLEKLDFAEER